MFGRIHINCWNPEIAAAQLRFSKMYQWFLSYGIASLCRGHRLIIKNKYIHLIEIIVFTLFLVSANGCAPEKGNRYYCSDEKFSIMIPAGWNVREKVKGTKILAEPPVEGEISNIKQNVNVLVDETSVPVSLEKYMDIQISSLNRIKRIQTYPRKSTVINGIPALWFIYSNTIQDFGYKSLVYSLTKNNKKFYVITGIAEFNRFNKHEAKFKEMAESFRFE